MKEAVFTTTDGMQIKLRPIASQLFVMIRRALEREFRERGEPIDPPTYSVTTASGAVETHTHDEKSLTTDAERAAWAEYQAATRRIEAAYNDKVARLIFTQGLALPPMPEDWPAKMKALGAEPAADPDERYTEYVTVEYLKTPHDIKQAIAEVMKLSVHGVPQEQMAAIEELFRSTLEG